MRALKELGDDKDGLDKIAAALVAKGLDGDVPALKEIGDRVDGKVTQPIAGDEEAGPIVVTWLKKS